MDGCVLIPSADIETFIAIELVTSIVAMRRNNADLIFIGLLYGCTHLLSQGNATMASEQTLVTRTISGSGLLRIPSDKMTERVYTLFLEVIRLPKSLYKNFKSNPPEGFYSRVTCMSKECVTKTFDQSFESQSYIFIPDPSGQISVHLGCVYDGILDTFENLGVALQKPPIITENLTRAMLPLGLPFSEFRIVCFADTAISAILKSIPYEKCGTDSVVAQVLPEPPAPSPRIPSGTGTYTTPAYVGDNITNPNAVDKNIPPPPIVGKWRLVWTTNTGTNGTFDYDGISTDVFKIVGGVSTTCTLSGRSQLVKNNTTIVTAAFNCNSSGFVSTLISQTFIPKP